MSELNNNVGNMSVEELKHWLFNFLQGRKNCKPNLSYTCSSHGYMSESDYLVSLIRKETNENLIMKLSQAVEMLLDEYLLNYSHLSKIFNNIFYDANFFSDLLYIYEILPGANYQILPKISRTLENYFKKHSRKLSSGRIKPNFYYQDQEENIRSMFHAMSSKVNAAPAAIKERTIHAGTYLILEEFYLKTVEFAVPAFCLLARINMKKAIEYLPDTINFLKKQNTAYSGLTLDLTGVINNDIETWKIIINTLQDDEEIKKLLRSAIDCLDTSNKHEIIKLFTNSGSKK